MKILKDIVCYVRNKQKLIHYRNTRKGIKSAGLKTVKIWKAVYGFMVQLLFPLRCPVCDEIVVPFGEKICGKCMDQLRYIASPRCFCCGKSLGDQEKEYCYDCSTHKHRYIRGRALYDYHSISTGIYRFKYRNRQEYADFFGEEIAYFLGDFIRMVKPDGLVPIPLHARRLKKRGYNQAFLLAASISRYSGVPVYDKVIRRVKNTKPLKHLNPLERQNNLKKAFNLIGNDVKLSTIILIDDIYTTGSTIDEAAGVLLEGGVKHVYFITLACGAGL